MGLFRWKGKGLDPVPVRTFKETNVLEKDLEEALRLRPDVLEEELFIVKSQFRDFDGSQKAIDLLALDNKGRLVVVELKRTPTGDHAELQAIRYAAMVSKMTLEQITKAHAEWSAKTPTEEEKKEAETRVKEHLQRCEPSKLDTTCPRIILASAGFSKELTTSVLWLLANSELDIKCVELRLHETDDKERLLDASQIIPLTEESAYWIGVSQQRANERERQMQERKQRSNFRFSMVGIRDGETLVFHNDPSKECTVIDANKPKVKFKDDGEEYSLSGLAQKIEGKDSLQGPRYWLYEGETLQALREKFERESPRSAE